MAAKRGRTLLWSVRVVMLFTVATIGFNFEAIQNSMAWLHNLDVRSYNWISRLGVRKPRPQWVVGLEIDDTTFYGYLKQVRGDATDRRALGKLVSKSAGAGAAVIVLDINLTRESLDSAEPRKSQNQALLAAIKGAEAMHIPVVLGFGFETQGPDRFPQTHIFANEELPDSNNQAIYYRTRIGFDEAPLDLRTIPLVVPGKDASKIPTDYSSLSLQAVDAYEAILGISPRTRDVLIQQIKKNQFVYTSFLPQKEFPNVSAKDVLTDQPGALEALRHRIVLIGGNRHISNGSSDWLDSGIITPMEMRGMYFHANRIEGLLDNRISRPIPRWGAFFLDLALGALILYYSARSKGLGGRLRTLGVFFIPVGLAYIASVNLGYVLDFVAPLLLLLLHGFLEHYLDLRFTARPERGV